MDKKQKEDKIEIESKLHIKDESLIDSKLNVKDKLHIEDKLDIEDKNIEIWEDIVHIKDLLIALLICVSSTFFGYFIAPNEAPKPLFFGLIGTMIGFIIASIIINPKREFIEGARED